MHMCRAINGLADVVRTTRCNVAPELLLHLDAFAERDLPGHWREVGMGSGGHDVWSGAKGNGHAL